MTAAHAWLEGRLRQAPPALAGTMLEALPAGAPSVADALVEGALSLYRRVAGGSGQREDALPLLAADALFTHAFEAQAEADPEGIAALAERCERMLGEVAA